MADEMPYMGGVKNLPAILERIRSAGTPPKFTIDFLKTSLGFPSSTDRSVLKVLKALGFLSPDGVPTPRYNEFRNASGGGRALADGLRQGWSSLFLADQRAFALGKSQLKELFKSVTGKGEAVAEDMASTFRALADAADWAAPSPTAHTLEPVEQIEAPLSPPQATSFRLHSDIHIHLPPTSDVTVFTAIFRALRSELLDK